MRFLRKASTLVVALALCISAIGAVPVSASTAPVPVAPAIALDHTNNCMDTFTIHAFDGESFYYGGSPVVSGAAADIYMPSASDAFRPCSTGPGNDGTYVWVALTGPCGDDCITQIGITKCNNPTRLACDNPSVGIPHLFWVAAGCHGYAANEVHDLGETTYGLHHYEIYNTGTGYINATIDGHLYLHLALTNDRFDCYINNPTAQFFWERFDRGDSAGNSNALSYFDNVRIGEYGTGWHSPLWSSAACYYHQPDAGCSVIYPDLMTVYHW